MDSYSRFVTLLKIALPLAALALLSTLFLFARSPSQSGAIPFAELQDIAREPRIAAAHYTGVSSSGGLLDLRAAKMTPLPDARTDLEKPDATLISVSGTTYAIAARHGQMNDTDSSLVLSGLVHIESDTGFQMETRELNVQEGGAILHAPTALEVRAPFGRLTASQMWTRTEPQVTMDFTGGVRLIYQAPPTSLAPSSEEGTTP